MALEDIDAIETDSGEMCRAGDDYETFCATIKELRDLALNNHPLVSSSDELGH
jgi:hypothetical protein